MYQDYDYIYYWDKDILKLRLDPCLKSEFTKLHEAVNTFYDIFILRLKHFKQK